MAPQTRRYSFPKVIIEKDTDSEESSSEEEGDQTEGGPLYQENEEDEEEDEEEEVIEDVEGEKEDLRIVEEDMDFKKKKKVPITISLKKTCKVCKKTGHEAGFKGATYVDCPMKPCFLCKMPDRVLCLTIAIFVLKPVQFLWFILRTILVFKWRRELYGWFNIICILEDVLSRILMFLRIVLTNEGHTTMTCPHRVATEHGVAPAPKRNSRNAMEYVFERQLRPYIAPIKTAYVIPDQVNCAVIRYHSRRVTCLEFHPTNNNLLLSGDKKGQVGVWDFCKVHEKVVYGNIHSCIVNNMRFNPTNDGTLYAASSDGTISFIDMETGIASSLMNINPDGWQGPNTWRMLYGMDINAEKGVICVADNFGFLYLLDTRSNSRTGEAVLIHKKGSKVVGLHCNPLQPDLLLSCGNDHYARIWDMRRMEAGSSLEDLAHKRVVSSAYFSPISGTKILTTSQDNRLRVWDSIFSNLSSPSREIVHSHDFNRHLTPFRAEWDPKDHSESLIVIGRYISENYNGAALHPIDFIDINTGQLVAEVMDPNVTTISPVNKLHPREDVLASGSSRSLFIWRPKDGSEPVDPKDEKRIVVCPGAGKKGKRKFGDGSDDE